MSTSSYSQPKRSIPITYLLIIQADMNSDFSGAIPQSLEDHLVSICISYSLSFFTTLPGIGHFVVLTEMWLSCWCFTITTHNMNEHNYLVVSLYSLIRLHYTPTFKVQQHVKRTGTFYWSMISDPRLRLINPMVGLELVLIIMNEIPIILLLSWGMRD